jgi:dehydrodolichyl diphosphate syntase complex subunit NUS1
VLNAVEWCRTLGVQKLTVYEQQDMLATCTEGIRAQLPAPVLDVESSESETDYPLTPPPSDHSLSRPLSPSDAPMGGLIPITKITISTPRPTTRKYSPSATKRRQHLQKSTTHATGIASAPKSDLLLCLISGEAAKPAIAAAARALAREESRRLQSDPVLRQQKERQEYRYELSVKELEQILEDESGLSPPDFMIVHPIDCSYSPPAPPELHGFPPWHVRLTEIYQNYPREAPSQAPSLFSQLTLTKSGRLEPIPLEELHFRAALDDFATAEMRFGK